MEESVDMDTDIPSEHQVNDPQSKLRRKKSQLKEHQQARAKGNKLLERVLKGQSVWNISSK